MSKQEKKETINLELAEEKAEGIYSNLAVITHSPSEFVLDFIRVMPGMPKAKVQSRVIVTPQHAKRLMRALAENVKKFEGQHGPIKDMKGPEQMIPMNFGGPAGEA
jgi:hypothetical protein